MLLGKATILEMTELLSTCAGFIPHYRSLLSLADTGDLLRSIALWLHEVSAIRGLMALPKTCLAFLVVFSPNRLCYCGRIVSP